MRLIGSLAVLVLIAACSEDSTGNDDCSPSNSVVCMETNSFNPTNLTTASGTNVEWRNASSIEHTTTSNPNNPAACPTWDHTVDTSGTVARVLFNVAGPVTCEYYCKLHATPTTGQMRGSIVLQ